MTRKWGEHPNDGKGLLRVSKMLNDEQSKNEAVTSNPRRFALTRDPIRPLGVAMEHAKTGPWVPWEDCEVLIRERDEARDEAERMRRTRDEEIRRLRSAHETPAAREFTHEDPDLDMLLNATAMLLSGRANMDTGIYWQEALEKVQKRLRPAVEPSELSRALHTIDEAGKLSDWINRARPAITDLMAAYERRVRTDCTPADLVKEPWRCSEYISAEALLRDQPIAVVEIAAVNGKDQHE